MSGGNINAMRCAAYLRHIGIDVPESVAQRWHETEAATRLARRRARAELKRSCGHFNHYTCRIISDEFTGDVEYCHDCGRAVNEIPKSTPPSGGGERRTA